MNIKLTTAERLKDLRVVDHKLTLEQIAKATGILRSALGNYESREYKYISSSAIVKLAKFYKVSTNYLLCLTENKAMKD